MFSLFFFAIRTDACKQEESLDDHQFSVRKVLGAWSSRKSHRDSAEGSAVHEGCHGACHYLLFYVSPSLLTIIFSLLFFFVLFIFLRAFLSLLFLVEQTAMYRAKTHPSAFL